MTSSTEQITSKTTLADLAATRAGASRVFYRHGLDFCCHGRVSLLDACAKKDIDVDELVREIEAQVPLASDFQRWDGRPIDELVQHVVDHYHASHRTELPRLLEMARKIEKVHADKASCPHGLADHVEHLGEQLELHMQKEEQALFPMILSGRGRAAAMPIQIIEEEHEEHGHHLARLRELATQFSPPEDACGTWRALYLGLAEFDQEVMQHIHLENNVLFPRALRG